MTKPLNYDVDHTPPIDRLQETFGSQLEVFSLTEKLHLMGILAIHQQVISDRNYDLENEEYLMIDAYADHTFADENGKLTGACELLDGATNRDLRGLILALAHQIHSDR